MKEFWIYTAMRVGLFLGSFAIIYGVWYVAAEDSASGFWSVVIAFIVSGVASFYILERQRRAFAAKVESRAARASEKIEEQRSKEDTD